MDEGRQGLFHPDGRTAAADVAGLRQEFLHVDHRGGFVAGDLGCHLQVDLQIAGHHAHEEAVPVAAQHQGLEHLLNRLPQFGSDVVGREIVLVDRIWDELERHPRRLQQADGVGLLDMRVRSHRVVRNRKTRTSCASLITL